MGSIISRVSQLIQENKNFALCIVTYTEGSSPRKAGSKMIVYEDGTSEGSIGGGSIEKAVIEACPNIIKLGKATKYTYNLEDDLSMQCGGLMEVYIEPFKRSPSLYIFGGGHIGQALSNYAVDIGFTVTVFDNRQGIAENFDKQKINFIEGDYFKSIDIAEFDSNTYIVIVTHKHIYDEDILAAVARKPHAYLGMIGSRVKVQTLRKRFIEEKILTQEELDLIDMPIGVPIAAETPVEIAISILAKLIDVKNSKIKNG